jgi:hypothetical protein
MRGLLTHAATADCFITLPHPTQECGIVTAWWQAQCDGKHDALRYVSRPATRHRSRSDAL